MMRTFRPSPRRFAPRFLTISILLAALASAGLAAPADPISAQGLQQISALLQEKESRTPAQKKIDSNLLYALKISRHQAIATGVSTLNTGVDVLPGGSVVVDIVAAVSDPLLVRLEAVGARVIDYRAAHRNVRAEVPLESLETIASWSDVTFINPRQEARTVGNAAPPSVLRPVSPGLLATLKPGFASRAAAVRKSVTAALKARAALRPNAITAINVSEGRVTHKADLASATYGAMGAGVKVGVLSDGVSSLASIQASGDLGPVTVLPGQTGSGDEGTAMLEIVHDLAPNAQLYFATAFTSISSFSQNIKDLRTAGCDIIVDDVFYFVETPFQRGQAGTVASTTNGGLVTDAVATVTAAGALYFSSAGNSGNLDFTQSGTWEGDFADGGAVGAPVPGTGNLNDFDPTATVTAFDSVTAGSGSPANLYWSDPLGGSGNDYDLFVLNSAGSAVVSSSTNVQSGTQDPYEQVSAPATGTRLVIVKRTGAAARFLHLSTNRGRLAIGTSGETHGHSATPVPFAYTVAATPAAGAFGPPPNPVGPYPGVFTGSNHIELFSSDGLRRIFFNADSTAITPGNFSSTGGLLLQKPDFTAADGVSCAAPGFNPFYGTSAAAPHAAAIAALVKSGVAGLTRTQIQTALTSTAIDIEGAGTDRDSGVGILDAFAAVGSTGATPQAFLSVGTTTATEAPGNGNGFVEPGECATLIVQLTNTGAVSATGISATLTTTTPGVTVVTGSATYPDIAVSASAVNTPAFKFGLSNTVSCPLVVDFTLTVTYTGGPSPQVINFPLRTGAPPVTVNTTLDTTAPPNVSGVYTAITGTESPRLFRDTVVSVCGTAKGFPGTSGSGPYQFDAYTFTNCASTTACVTVTLNQTSGNVNALFSEAYSSSFNPASLGTNYLADLGVSHGLNAPASYSFNVAAGASFVVVVNETGVGTGIGANYTLTVDGMCLPCATYTGTGCSVTCPTITVAPATLPAGTVGVPYNQVVTPSGGVAPYTFSVTGLPAGMTFTPTATDVTIGGTPTVPFSGTVTVSGTDSNGCPFSMPYAFTVNCPPLPPTVVITSANAVCSLSIGNTASVPNTGSTYAWTITNGTITSGQGTNAITFSAGASGPIMLTVTITAASGCPAGGGTKQITVDPTCSSFFTLTPCRLVDTRNANGPLGGPALQAGAARTFVATGNCGIPSTAKVVSVNLAVVQPTGGGNLQIYPGGSSPPASAVINYSAGQIRANNALVVLGPSGDFTVQCNQGAGTTNDLVVDINGYFQ